ncbi:rod shape-determining protein RodA [Verrucomicrobiota bacterium]
MIHILHPYQLRRLEWIMVLVTVLLLGIGVAFIYSAGHAIHEPVSMRFYRKQLLWAGIGIVFFLGFAMTDYHVWTNASWWLYGAGIVLLVLVLMPQVGYKVYGARRWIQVAGVRILQPSELMKLAVIILLAKLFGWPGRDVRRVRFVFLALILVIVPMVLIVRQPDLGTALIFLPVLFGIMFAAGVPFRVLGVLLALGVLVSSLVLTLILLPPKVGWSEDRQEQALELIGITSYQRDRVLVFFDSDRDPLGAGWSKAQSQIAVGSGRFWGKGYLNGTQNILGFLPRTVAPNDFIFSVIAEEKGFVGSAVVLILFAVMIGSGMRAALVGRDKIGRLLCIGIVTMLFCHIFINVAMTIGLVPITGTPLPLISYGGTFMVGTMSALGIMQSVYIRGDWR